MPNENELEEILEKNFEEMTIEEIAALEVEGCTTCGIEVE